MIHNLLGLDLYVNSLATCSPQRLMNHDPAVRHAVPLASLTRTQQERAHGGSKAKAVGLHVGTAEHHGVVDAHAGCYAATCTAVRRYIKDCWCAFAKADC